MYIKRRGLCLSFCLVLFRKVQFVNLLGGESQLGDDVGIGGVTVEGICFGGNVEAVFLPEPVEIIFHMEAVHALGRTVDVVILTTVMTVDGKTVFKIVADLGLAQGDKAVATGEGVDIHFVLIAVYTIDDLLADLLLLPLKPVGNVGEFGLALGGLQLAVFLEEPAFATVVAEDFSTLGTHLEFGVAMGALVEHFLETFRPVGLGDQNVVLQLVAVFVILHGRADDGVDLVGSHLCHLLSGEHLAEGGVQGDFPLVGIGPEGRIEMVAVMGDHNKRYLIHLHQSAQGIGQVGGGSNGSVPCFRVHTEDVAVLNNSADGLDQVDVVGKLSGADGTNPGQKPGHHVVAVNIDHIVDRLGGGDHSGQFEVDEGLMVAEDDVRGFKTFHINGFQGVLFADQTNFGQTPDYPSPEFGLAHGIFGGFIVLFPAVVDFHNGMIP